MKRQREYMNKAGEKEDVLDQGLTTKSSNVIRGGLVNFIINLLGILLADIRTIHP